MKKTKSKTDDLSFGQFLNSIDHNALIEHVKENILPEVIVDIILENKNLQNDCIAILFKDDINLSSKLRYSLLAKELSASDDDVIISYMSLLFSKKTIINMLIEYTDESTRLDIIDNENMGQKPNINDIIYN